MDSMFPVAERLLNTATLLTEDDPVAAYLCVWTALDHVIHGLAVAQGVRPQFSLRKNGTRRTRKVGNVKLPEVYPPREERLMGAALDALPEDVALALVSHPHVARLAQRTPILDGALVSRDASGQVLYGVIDVLLTPDARYPVWAFIDRAALKRVCNGGADEAAVRDVVEQVVGVLNAIRHACLIGRGHAGAEDDVALARAALPVVMALVEGLMVFEPLDR